MLEIHIAEDIRQAIEGLGEAARTNDYEDLDNLPDLSRLIQPPFSMEIITKGMCTDTTEYDQWPYEALVPVEGFMEPFVPFAVFHPSDTRFFSHMQLIFRRRTAISLLTRRPPISMGLRRALKKLMAIPFDAAQNLSLQQMGASYDGYGYAPEDYSEGDLAKIKILIQ